MGVGGNSTSLFIPNLKHGHLYTSTFDELFGATLDVNKNALPRNPCEVAPAAIQQLAAVKKTRPPWARHSRATAAAASAMPSTRPTSYHGSFR